MKSPYAILASMHKNASAMAEEVEELETLLVSLKERRAALKDKTLERLKVKAEREKYSELVDMCKRQRESAQALREEIVAKDAIILAANRSADASAKIIDGLERTVRQLESSISDKEELARLRRAR